MDEPSSSREADEARAHALLTESLALKSRGRIDQSLATCRQALTLAPHRFDGWTLLGMVLRQAGQWEEAIAAYAHASSLAPDYADASNNLGNLLKERLRLAEAEVAFKQALRAQPTMTSALLGLSDTLRMMDRCRESEEVARRLLELAPDLPQAHLHLGNALMEQNDLDGAVDCYHRVLQLDPGMVEAWSNLGNCYRELCLLPQCLAHFEKALEIRPDLVRAHGNLLFCLHYDPSRDARSLLARHRQWDRSHGRHLASHWRPHTNDRDPDRPLRVGYLSGDFKGHPVGMILLAILPAHDPKNWEIHCYATNHDEDEITRRLRGSAKVWRQVAGMTDQELDLLIRKDQIDILVDLAGHTMGNRMTVMARKPAPVQVTWIGYEGTTGLAAMDYLIADPREIPLGEEGEIVEQVLRLPDSYLCFEPPTPSPPVSPLPALTTGVFTFGCFNNLFKINDQVLDLWVRMLQRIPESRLFLMTKQLERPTVRQRMASFFDRQGVGERVELAGSQPYFRYLESYAKVDLCLDPFPFSGGMTTLESLWMGVPILTLKGNRFASRHTETHLTAVGLSRFVADDQKDFLEKAAKFAQNPRELADLRGELRARVAASPLCNGPLLVRHLESLYRQIWQTWCRDPGWESHFRQGEELLSNGQLARAEVAFQRAVSMNPSFQPGWLGLAQTLDRLWQQESGLG